jgi:NitT/TauT family transport system substrate-binding protein
MQLLTRSGALGALAASTLPFFPTVARSQAPATLRVGGVGADTYAEGYYALDQGFFERAGLNVEILTFNNGSAMAAAAAGGSIDFGAGDAAELANGFNRGIPFQLVAGGAYYVSAAPTTTLCIEKSSTISQASDLEGQNVAIVSLVSLSTSALKSWLTQHGADLTKIHFIELPFSQMPVALERGTVAAACISEPVMSGALANGAKIFASVFDAIAKQFLISEWYTTRDVLTKSPDVVRRFVGAIYDAARWANTHHDESATILAKYTKTDVDRLRHINRALYATDLRPKMMQPVLDTAFKYHSLEKATSAGAMIGNGFSAA